MPLPRQEPEPLVHVALLSTLMLCGERPSSAAGVGLVWVRTIDELREARNPCPECFQRAKVIDVARMAFARDMRSRPPEPQGPIEVEYIPPTRPRR